MNLLLCVMPDTLRGPDNPDYKGRLRPGMRYLAPDAASSILRIERDTNGLVFTDMFRSAKSQLDLHKKKPYSTKQSGYSAHNFGLAVDLDVTATLRRLKVNYATLIDIMGKYGWFCHRRDMKASGSEHWHFNFLSTSDVGTKYLELAHLGDPRTWDEPVECAIWQAYKSEFILDAATLQTKLKGLKHYHGPIDGVVGPMTRKAIKDFQSEWRIPVTAMSDKMTQRTLAYCTANLEFVPLPSGAVA